MYYINEHDWNVSAHTMSNGNVQIKCSKQLYRGEAYDIAKAIDDNGQKVLYNGDICTVSEYGETSDWKTGKNKFYMVLIDGD